jgi:cytochrome c oxidase assembly protein subunit 15
MRSVSAGTWGDRLAGRLPGLATALMFVVVVLSAHLRLSAADLGCRPWPACYASLDAMQAGSQGVVRAVHRAAASAMSIVVLGCLWFSWRRGRDRVVTVAMVALTALLAWVGLHTPAPLAPWVTLVNVAGGMALLGACGWLWLRPAAPVRGGFGWRRLAAAGGVLVVFTQVVLGAWASAHYSEPACPGLLCPRQAPPARLAEAFDPARSLTAVQGRVAADDAAALVQQAHRLGGLTAFTCLLALVLFAPPRSAASRRARRLVLALLFAQAWLGVGASVAGYPLWAAAGHGALAALLLLAVIRLHHAYARD